MNSSYKKLALTIGIHFVIMYFLVFVPVNVLDDAKLFNLRNLYKALIMVAPMVFLMVLVMRDMYPNKQRNKALLVGSLVLFVSTFYFIRAQTFVGNEQFLKSMIPHHSAAITMCQEANITDSEIETLCDEIVAAQQKEIDQMNKILERLN